MVDAMPSRPHVRRRRARRNETRERILDAARALFALEGFDAVTLRRIGDRCEYAPSAIYKHFPNKEAILEELRRDASSRLALAMTEGIEAVASRFGGPLAALREACRRYLLFGAREGEAYALIFQNARPVGQGESPTDPDSVIEALADLIARGRSSDGEVIEDYDRDVARVLWHALHGRALGPRAHQRDDESFVDLCLGALPLGFQPDE